MKPKGRTIWIQKKEGQVKGGKLDEMKEGTSTTSLKGNEPIAAMAKRPSCNEQQLICEGSPNTIQDEEWSEEDRKQILEMGSLHITSLLFILRPWKLFIEDEFSDLKTIPIWVLMKKFSMELWDDEGFGRVANTIGTPLFVDNLIESMARISYARVCVEIEKKCTYPDHAKVVLDTKKTFKIPFEYKWKPHRCTRDLFGHSEQNCLKRKLENKKKNGDKVWVQTGAMIVDEDEPVRGHE
ncbi:hypothetical protein FRX31_029640 [Thalictrum thalictroides]|uniref:DUF4283 domain-containing protein n=1 Tax=Thalictrum thalictroides TaxID=46969 RepID=A0A7J6V6M8_THATH|nr:hypothetical protein FRX31_029640 [Thalictrum thalictroides]